MVKNLPAICLQCKPRGFDPWAGKIPRRRKWLPTPVFLLGEFHGQRSLAFHSQILPPPNFTKVKRVITKVERGGGIN